MQIRKAELKDIPALTELTSQLGYPLTEDAISQNLHSILANDNEIIFVMTENDKPIAWIHIFHSIRLESGSFCELGGLVVDEHHRSKGIGKLLIDKAIEWTRKLNVPILKLRSNVIRRDAHRFYNNFGFTEVKEQKVFEMKISGISIAVETDIPSMVSLMNSAYRGNASKKGWTTEADLIDGELRTDEKHLQELMRDPNVRFLKLTGDSFEMEGCVFLQKRNEKLYLGMLSVNPELQAKGTGKKLMMAAEEHAKKSGCTSVVMRVISTRDELIAWYERQGYRNTGLKEPFEDSRFGKAKTPIEFIVMEKTL